MPAFTCKDCGASFDLPDALLARYPGWTPRQCRTCRDAAKSSGPGSGSGSGSAQSGKPARPAGWRSSATVGANLTLAEILERFHDGPQDGVFTDGGASPNPGPGGWGVVRVRGGEILAQRHGHEPHTTNNRMELTALIEAVKLVPRDEPEIIRSDSELAVNTAKLWARSWEKAGWKRRTGPIKNLDLVQELWSLVKDRPELTFEWVPSHSGWLWNEYADSLANAHARDEL